MKRIIELIDESLAQFSGRNVVTIQEHQDVLLDLRLACTDEQAETELLHEEDYVHSG